MSEADKANIVKQKTRKRGSIKAKLTVLKNYLERYNKENDNIENLKIRITVLDDVYKDYCSIHDEIAEYINLEDESVAEDYEDKLTEMFTLYCDLKAAFTQKINEVEPVISHSSSGSHQNGAGAGIVIRQVEAPIAKLPTISITKFSGNIREWLTFKNTFEALVVKRVD
jgi:hypothetical protein